MPPAKTDIAVLMLFFTRSDTLQLVFNEVRKARPSRLFLYQDGPRGPQDMPGIEACRQIVSDEQIVMIVQSMIFGVVGIALPSMVLGPLMRYFFGVQLKWLPVVGWGTADKMIMPAIVLGLGTVAGETRAMRASMLGVMTQDYITTARAKGLNSAQVVLHHEVKNSLVPTITFLGQNDSDIIGTVTGNYSHDLEQAVQGVKTSEERRHEYMIMMVKEQELINKGIEQGRESEKKRITALNNLLAGDGRIDDLMRSFKDPEYQNKLLEEYGL